MLALGDEPASGGASGHIAVFSWSFPLPQTGRAASASAPACRLNRSQGSADARRRAPHSPGKVVPGRCAVLNSAPPSAVSPSTSQRPAKVRMLVHQSAARFWDDPALGTDQERHRRPAITDAEADQMCRQLLEIAIGSKSGDDPGKYPSEALSACGYCRSRCREREGPRSDADRMTRHRAPRAAIQERDDHGRRQALALDPRLEPNAATPG